MGSTIPILGACMAGVYGMMAFSEQQMVNSIEQLTTGPHEGKLLINVATTAFTSRNLICDVRDVMSVFSLGNDDLGDDNLDGNVIQVSRFIDAQSGEEVTQPEVFSLPGDAYRDKPFMDWILSNKEGEETTTGDFH